MIDGIPLLDIGQSGLIAMVVILVLTDRLVWHKRLVKRDQEIVTLRAQNTELIDQNGLLLKSAIPTVNATLNALQDAADRSTP